MGRGSLHETTFPKVKAYLSKSEKALTVKDVAQFLEMSNASAHGVLKLMEVFKIVRCLKRGRLHYYILTDVVDDDQIEAMLPPNKVAPIPRRRRYSAIPSPPSFDDSFMEEYLSAVRTQPGSGEGLAALSMIGLSQEERTEEELPQGGDKLYDLGMDAEVVNAVDGAGVEEMRFGVPISVEPFATVEYLPKEVRLLNSGDARYLKDQLKALDGYEEIKGFGAVFASFSALEYGRYGEVLYFSPGTNQWEYVKKITIDRSISDFIVLPIIERKRWSSWNHFLMGLKETREKYGKEEYDRMIDQFMESGHSLVEMTVENRGSNYVRNVLRKRIVERGLEEQVKASYVDEWIYLERVESI